MSGPGSERPSDPVPEPVPEHEPEPEPEPRSEGYSATALGSHWFEGPADASSDDRTGPEPWAPGSPRPAGGVSAASPVPDRVDGEVRRFGPGVTAPARIGASQTGTATAVWHGGPGPGGKRRRGPGRYTLAVTVLVIVLAVLVWQRYGQSIAVDRVSARPTAPSLGCDGTADIVAVVGTNGRPGTLVYRWVRSDGTSSGRLREKLSRGQKQAKLRLLWSFRGEGRYRASAELRIVSPSSHRTTARFVYRCG
ncbi:hypothetical protein [Streptomyces jumonjinensis]|uniref:hypothetical protein n=1 Tax=Streptomyces jumonjinensis TaxID=1945 RepID=UPI00378957CB